MLLLLSGCPKRSDSGYRGGGVKLPESPRRRAAEAAGGRQTEPRGWRPGWRPRRRRAGRRVCT